jgi:hypothetical protein
MDMDSNEDPFTIPPEVLAAIGQVAVNAATLETVMAGVVLRIHPTADTEMIKSTPRISKALKHACVDLKQADPALGERAEEWHQQAEDLLLNRHSVVHSVLGGSLSPCA